MGCRHCPGTSRGVPTPCFLHPTLSPSVPDRDLAGRRLLAVTEEEFQRVVLDVHDGPVQHLFAALSQLAVARARLPRGRAEEARARDACAVALDRAGTLLERALEEIR